VFSFELKLDPARVVSWLLSVSTDGNALPSCVWAPNLLFEPVYQNYATCQRLNSASVWDCQKLFETQMATARQQRPTAVAIVAVAPIPFAWLLGYALVGIVRWIRRGFQPSSQSSPGEIRH
jgi:hypothetical protein